MNDTNARRERSSVAFGHRTSIAHPARVYDYLLGGKDNFAADREAAEAMSGRPRMPSMARDNREFLRRAVRFLVAEAGHPAVPRHRHRHPDRAQHPRGRPGVDPDARVVYVDNDPIVLAHARALLTSSRRAHRVHRRPTPATPRRPGRPGAAPDPRPRPAGRR